MGSSRRNAIRIWTQASADLNGARQRGRRGPPRRYVVLIALRRDCECRKQLGQPQDVTRDRSRKRAVFTDAIAISGSPRRDRPRRKTPEIGQSEVPYQTKHPLGGGGACPVCTPQRCRATSSNGVVTGIGLCSGWAAATTAGPSVVAARLARVGRGGWPTRRRRVRAEHGHSGHDFG